MTLLTNRFVSSSFFLAGTIIGVGMFTLPYVFVQSGFFIGLAELVLLTCVTITMHLCYGEVVLRTKSRHLLPGFVKRYLGQRWFYASALSGLGGFIGGLFVYILIGGTFLAHLFNLPVGVGQLLFFTAGALIMLANLKVEVNINYALTVILVIFILLITAFSLRHFSLQNFSGVHPKNVFLPYGVILFSLAGGAVIPELASFLGEKRKLLKRVLILGTTMPAVVYAFFVLGVVGATGSATSPEALAGLLPVVGTSTYFLGNVVGFLATFTSFVIFGFTFEDVLRSDFGIQKKTVAWFMATGLPALIFLLPFRNFIYALNVLGAVAIGIDSVFVLWLYEKTKRAGERVPEYTLNIPRWGIFLFGILFFVGLVAPLFS